MPTIKSRSQPGILAPVPPNGRSATYRLALETDPHKALATLQRGFRPAWGVLGIGAPLAKTLKADIPGLRPFPALSGAHAAVPSTQQDLWIFLRGRSRGEVFDRTEATAALLGTTFIIEEPIDTFMYAGGRDLTGYKDGTANPKGKASVSAALIPSGDGLGGSGYVAVQRWVHDLARFRSHTPKERDHIIGRRRDTNAEIEDAPPSAHVKRTEQEDYTPAAFMIRRSMPWANGAQNGLEFIAYAGAPDTYERVMRRMVGLEDGIVDAIFTYSRAISGGYYWCPPVKRGKLDLSRLGI